ncbi:AAA family ATPase [Candidatus Pacearchaeota archaeon]|nr:AAA family ATPase [Candidatus Pacearchaeota archaeon]
MKLSKVTIENYRGFYDENVIEFDTDKKEKNINLVIARNDTGKTTFLNAIYWCLYGKEQFYSTRNKSVDRKIMSHKKIMETSIDGRMKIKVSLVFNDEKGPKYEISRERVFKRGFNEEDNLRIIPQGEDILYGMEMNKSGTGFENIEHIKEFIASTIPEGISSFFLLDGERLKAIFSSDINYKIRDAIERVANIDSINEAIQSLSDLNKKYSNMKSGISPNFGAIQKEIDNCDLKLEENSKNLKEIMKDNEELKKTIMELGDFLRNHNEVIIREFGAREKRIIEENESIAESLKSDEDELNELVINSYILKNSNKSLNATLRKFEEIISGGNFPPAVDPAHVLQLIKRKECICGREIRKNSEEEKKLKQLADAQSYKQYVRIISEGDSRLPEIMEDFNKNLGLITILRKRISESEAKLQKNKKDLEEINQSLKDSDAEDIKEKAEEKEMVERAIYKNEREINTLERNIGELIELKKTYELDLTKYQIKSQKDTLIIKKSEKCKQLIDYAKKIKEEIMKKIKDEIEENTARNFIELHWRAEDYEKVTISDDFSLSIKDKYKGEILNELSQGAALCFGLAFMGALRNYSGYDVPIIIDSPVGKIDEGNRENIATSLPKQLKDKQIILLVTNSEYVSVFKESLKNKISTKINFLYNKKTGEIDITNGSD